MFTPFLLKMATDDHSRMAIFMLKTGVTSVVVPSFTIDAPIPFTIFLSSADTGIH